MQENTAKTAAEWVIVAKSVAQMPGSESQALRCMARAGMAARAVSDWIAVAEAWAKDFGDSDMAGLCMDKAENNAEGSGDWKLIGDARAEIGNYERTSYWRTKLPSLEVVKDYRDFVGLATLDDSGSDNFFEDDEDDFIDLLLAADCKDFISEAEKLIDSDYGQALHRMAQAEAIAKFTFDWTAIAKSWVSEFKDSDNARRCLEQAEAVAQNVADWILIADSWSDLDNTIRCVLRAGDAAKDVRDWMLIARYHIKRYPVADSLEDCFYQAELLAKSDSDWNLIERTANETSWTYRVNAARRRITLEQYIASYGLR